LHASRKVVFGGRSACNCSVSLRSSSGCAASCSLAVGPGPFLIHLSGLLERAAAPTAPSKMLTPAAPIIRHLFFMVTSLQDGRGLAPVSHARSPASRLGRCGTPRMRYVDLEFR